MRGRNYFVAPTRELDPFFTVGLLHSRGQWVYSAVGTIVFNVRHPTFPFSIPDVGNNSIIADFEVSHPISHRFPGVVAFLRAEPIWNWASRGTPGISGFDFRLFTGLRFTMVKPAYHESIRKLRKQLKESAPGPNNQPTSTPGTPSSGTTPPGNTGGAGNSTPPPGNSTPGSSTLPPGNSAPGTSTPAPGNSNSGNPNTGNSRPRISNLAGPPSIASTSGSPIESLPLREAISPDSEMVLDSATTQP
jgi:hypothetical protein